MHLASAEVPSQVHQSKLRLQTTDKPPVAISAHTLLLMMDNFRISSYEDYNSLL